MSASIATVVQVYSNLQTKNPNTKPQEIAEQEENEFIEKTYGLIKDESPDAPVTDFYTLKAPTDPKNAGPNYWLFCAIIAGVLKDKLPAKLLNAAEQSDCVQKIE